MKGWMFEILFLLGAVLLLGFLGYWVFQRTRIPEPVVLIAFGFMLGEVGLSLLAPQGVDAALIISLAPAFGAFAIVFYLFEAGTSLNVQDVFRQLSFSTLFGIGNILISFSAIAAVLFFGLNFSLAASVLVAAVLAGPSAISINAMLGLLPIPSGPRNILTVEGVLATIITPIIAMTALHYIGSPTSPANLLQSLAYTFAFSLLMGAAVGAVWINILNRFKVKSYSYVTTMALMLILFFIDFSITGIGVVAVTVAGIVIGNYGRLATALKAKWVFDFGEEFLAPAREFTMFVRTFFFAYIGIAISAVRLDEKALLAAGVITLCIFLSRLAWIRALKSLRKHAPKGEDFVLAFLSPRGVMNAALAVFAFLPGYSAPSDFSAPVVFVAIFASMLVTSISMNYYEHTYRKTMLFSTEVALRDGRKAVVRAVTADDLGLLKNFINELVSEGAMIVYDRRIRNEGDMGVLEEDLAKANAGNSIYWVALVDGKMIGRIKAERKSLRERNNVELSIYLSKGYRGLGLGSAMLKMIIEKAKTQLDPKNIFLSVYSKNEPAIKLYRKLGFKLVGKFPKWGQFGNDYIDVYYMVYSPRGGKR
ncbi:MAG: GNAT family N-acetyltransferase [Candidatus Micrarchaeota archaeon]